MKYSILIPAYKSKYLKECIDSILSQTYPEFEVIIVNDASPEDIDSIINSYTDNRIHYFKNEKNCGAINVVDNWNKCLNYATGEYVICMGDDDKLLPNCLIEYSNLIKKYPSLYIYHAWTQIINENSDIISIQEARPEREYVFSMMWERFERNRIQFIGDFLFKTQHLKSIGGFYKLPLAWGSDDISIFRAAQVNGIANTQIPTFQYRISSQTISKSNNTIIKMEAIEKSIVWYKNFLNENEPQNDIEKIFYSMIIQRFNTIMLKKKIGTISIDLITQYNIKRIFFWIKRIGKYNLNPKMLLYAIIEAVKSRKSGNAKKNIFI